MIITGAGGHAKEIAMVLSRNEEHDLVFYDETIVNDPGLFLDKWPVIWTIEDIKYHQENDDRFILGVGNPLLRERFFNYFSALAFIPQDVIDPTVIIASSSKYGAGINFMPYSMISEGTTLGEGCLINAYAHIHHDATVGRFSELSPGASVMGSASVGDFSQLGANSVILPKVKIGNNVKIGAGAVVTENVPDNCFAAGVPARVIR
jgi:sugar O-acyltransferase (sialic acid O-acetyltransferase NeuD family)